MLVFVLMIFKKECSAIICDQAINALDSPTRGNRSNKIHPKKSPFGRGESETRLETYRETGLAG